MREERSHAADCLHRQYQEPGHGVRRDRKRGERQAGTDQVVVVKGRHLTETRSHGELHPYRILSVPLCLREEIP